MFNRLAQALPFAGLPASNRLGALLPPAFSLHSAVSRVVNFLLLRSPWAMQRLAAYSGRLVAIEWGTQSFQFEVTQAGLLAPHFQGRQPANVRLILAGTDWAALGSAVLQQEPGQIAERLRIEGDVGFAKTLAEVAGQLHWDAEADLAQFTGDILAVRLVQALQGSVQWIQQCVHHVRANLAEYLGHESGWLTHQDYATLLNQRQQELEHLLTQAEQRVTRLESVSG